MTADDPSKRAGDSAGPLAGVRVVEVSTGRVGRIAVRFTHDRRMQCRRYRNGVAVQSEIERRDDRDLDLR